MDHVDPEVVALLALGEPVADDAAATHLATCPICAAELEALTAAVTVGRTVTADDTLLAPPPAVWERVRAELALSESLRPDGTGPAPSDHDGRELDQPVPRSSDARSSGPSRSLPRVRGWVAAAAAAGLVVGGAGGAWWVQRADAPPAASIVAEATLEPLPGWTAAGEATVAEEPDGTRLLTVTLDGAVSETGFREVWLIDRDVTRLVSLGILQGQEGTFAVPSGLDLSDFPVVDVSEETLDGNPAHSGDSIIRGVLGV